MFATSNENSQIFAAIFNATKAIKPIERDIQYPDSLNRHASLDAILGSILPVLHRLKILCLHAPARADGAYGVQTRLIHIPSGQWIEAVQLFPLDKPMAKDLLMAESMARRFNLLLLLNLTTTDAEGGGEGEHPTPATLSRAKAAEAAAHVRGPFLVAPSALPAAAGATGGGVVADARPEVGNAAPVPAQTPVVTPVAPSLKEVLEVRDRLEEVRIQRGEDDKARIMAACFPHGFTHAGPQDLARARDMIAAALVQGATEVSTETQRKAG